MTHADRFARLPDLLAVDTDLIRRGRWQQHRAVMLSAFGVSVLFLISYVVYHASAGSRPYQGEGLWRTVYFTILITHVVLAGGIGRRPDLTKVRPSLALFAVLPRMLSSLARGDNALLKTIVGLIEKAGLTMPDAPGELSLMVRFLCAGRELRTLELTLEVRP